MSKQQTALQISIQRKKDRVTFCTEQIEALKKLNGELSSQVIGVFEIEVASLKDCITEDEKLLAVEREQIESAYFDGYNNTSYFIGEGGFHEKDLSPDSTDYYNQQFKND
jgi:hypothetical protein